MKNVRKLVSLSGNVEVLKHLIKFENYKNLIKR